MSQSDLNRDSIATRRPRRNIKLTHKAEELLETGESVPGIQSPNQRPNNYFPTENTVTNASVVSSMAVPLARSEKARGQPSRVPTFAPEKFAIYHWERPRPKDFLNLSNSHKAWKRRTDVQERAADIDDSSDDWENFAAESDKYVVARTFVQRAKRAFRRGKTWEEFENHERSVDSETSTTPASAVSYQLNNAFRIEVLDSLKRRLCEEIWLEPYRNPPGLVRLPLPRNDSPMASAGGAYGRNFVPGTGGRLLAPSEEEAERGVVAWSMHSGRQWEPRYRGEHITPPGLRTFMHHWRTQRHEGSRNGAVVSRTVEDNRRLAFGNIGIAGSGMTAAEEIAMREPDFETSDESDG